MTIAARSRARDHSYFGFNDWEAELHFDNLKITPQ